MTLRSTSLFPVEEFAFANGPRMALPHFLLLSKLWTCFMHFEILCGGGFRFENLRPSIHAPYWDLSRSKAAIAQQALKSLVGIGFEICILVHRFLLAIANLTINHRFEPALDRVRSEGKCHDSDLFWSFPSTLRNSCPRIRTISPVMRAGERSKVI